MPSPRLLTRVALCLSLVCGACSGPPANVQAPTKAPDKTVDLDVKSIANKHVRALATGQHATVHERFDDTMKTAMTVDELGALWPGLETQAGTFQDVLDVGEERKDQLDVVTVTCRFERATLDVRIVFDPERRITGLFVRPTDMSAAYEPPAYGDVSKVDAIELSIGDDEWAVPGTLTSPKALAGKNGSCPGVVLVHGSGPHDRDETIGPNKPFRDLALGLANRGVCVLRYEKRTAHHGELAMKRFGDNLTIKEETVDDALAAATALRRQPMIDPDRVFVLGHSLGGHAVPRIAKRDTSLAGFIIMAGNTRPLEDVVVEQVRYIADLDGKRSSQESAAIERLVLQAKNVKALTAESVIPPAQLPLGIAAPYWLDIRAHDPAVVIQPETRPILVLQGERDYQVTLADFAGWKKALAGNESAEFVKYPKLNHLFIAGEGPSAPAEYQTPGHVAEAVIGEIATFVTRD